MKRLCLAMLTGGLMSAIARPCMIDAPRSSFSPNGRYCIVAGANGIVFLDGVRELWGHPSEWATHSAVSDNGELALCHTDKGWTLFNNRGERLAVIQSSPIELELDPPRTCWTSGGSHYVELSQGDIFTVTQNQWRKVGEPGGVPSEVQEHRRLPVSDQVLSQFLNDPITAGIPPNFRNLSSGQVRRLRQRLSAGQPGAALVLGLSRCQQARAELLKASFAPNSEPAEEAQRAVLLLDGPRAAQELVPALEGWTSRYLMRLYEQVPCPEAVPLLLRHLSRSADSSHAALVAQTRVDLGYNVPDWRNWLANRDKRQLEGLQEPSAPHWKAMQEDSDLGAILMKQPRLIARFDLGGDCEEISVRGDRLIRLEGDAHKRTLEWSLVDGRALVTIPVGLNDNAQFNWNSQRQLLYYHYSHYRGLWQGQHEVFAEDLGWERQNGKSFRGMRPCWLPAQLYMLRFSPDGAYVEGDLPGRPVRISISDGTRRPLVENSETGLTSPDGNLWLGPRMLMDKKLGLIYRTTAPLRHACFSPDSRILAATMDDDIALFEAKDFRMIRKFPCPERQVMSRLAFDDTGRRLSVLADDGRVWLYDLNPQAPDLTGDPRLVTECWTGYRLSGGGARQLTEAEYWQRRRRLAEMPPLQPSPYFPVVAGFLGIGLLGFAYVVAGRGIRSSQ